MSLEPVSATPITSLGDIVDRDLFGKLIRVLREEFAWTQKELAEESGLGKRTIERIEDGTLKQLNENILLSLANAFALTTAERREFFFAAVGIENMAVASPEADPAMVLKKLINITKSLAMPAFIHDHFGDIVAANTTIIKLLGISEQAINESATMPAGFNILRIIFDPSLGYKKLLNETQWHKSALTNIQFFRYVTLRYRADPYFISTLSILKKQVLFKKYWQTVHLDEEDPVVNTEYFNYEHPEYGRLEYLANVSLNATSKGDLHLAIYTPINTKTTELFKELSKDHNRDTFLLAPWPDKI